MEQEESAYITSVHLKGYKSIRDVSVTLNKGLNILIGANGSGKTNFLEFLDAAIKDDYEYLFNSQNRKFDSEIITNNFVTKMKGERVFTKDSKEIAFRIEQSFIVNKNEFIVVIFLDENKRILKQNHQGHPSSLSFNYSPLLLKFENPLQNSLKEKLALNIECFFYNQEDLIPETYGRMYEFNSNLINNGDTHAFLNDIFRINYKSMDDFRGSDEVIAKIVDGSTYPVTSLQQNLKQFSPIKDIKIDWRFIRTSTELTEENDLIYISIKGIDFQFYVNNEWINWMQLSDGTKRLFYLIGSVTYATKNEIILIEEPELGVHPHQLALLMNFLKSESEDKQIIISTHSPQVLNCLGKDELDRIIVARHEGKAGTKLYHLSEEEKGYASEYMINEAFLSDYWMLSGFMNEEPTENA